MRPQLAAFGIDCEQMTWTSSGHFVLVWWADDKIRINDPNSAKDIRLNGDPATFKSQVKYYWWIDAREYNNPAKTPEKEEDIMTGSEIIAALTDEQAYELLTKAQRHAAVLPEPAWSRLEGHWQRLVADGAIKRDEVIAILGRKGLV